MPDQTNPALTTPEKKDAEKKDPALEIKEQAENTKAHEREAAKRKKAADDSEARRQDVMHHFAEKGWASWRKIGEDLEPGQQEDEASIKSGALISKLENGVYKREPELIKDKNYLIKVSGDKDNKSLSIVDGPRLNPLNNYFEESYGELIDLLKIKTGSDTITIEYSPQQLENGIRIPELEKILEIAKDKGVEAKFGPNLEEFLEKRAKNLYDKFKNINRFKTSVDKDTQDRIVNLRKETAAARQKKSQYKDLHKNQIFSHMKEDIEKKPSLGSELGLGMDIKADPKNVTKLAAEWVKDAKTDDEKKDVIAKRLAEIEAGLTGDVSADKLKELKEKEEACKKILNDLPKEKKEGLEKEVEKVAEKLSEAIDAKKPPVTEMAKKLTEGLDDSKKIAAVGEQLSEIEDRLKTLQGAKDEITKHGAAVVNALNDKDSGFTATQVGEIRDNAKGNRDGLLDAMENQRKELEERAKVCAEIVRDLPEGDERKELEERIGNINSKIEEVDKYQTSDVKEADKKEDELDKKIKEGNLPDAADKKKAEDEIAKLRGRDKARDYDKDLQAHVQERVAEAGQEAGSAPKHGG